QGAEFIDPSKTALTGEALLVNGGIEEAFTPPFGLLAVTLVLADVGNDLMIETDFASFPGIKGAIGVEIGSGKGQSQTFHPAESDLEVGFEVEGIMMVACHNGCRSNHIAFGIHNGQDVAGFRSLAGLIGDTFTAFLGNGMTTIQVHLG